MTVDGVDLSGQNKSSPSFFATLISGRAAQMNQERNVPSPLASRLLLGPTTNTRVFGLPVTDDLRRGAKRRRGREGYKIGAALGDLVCVCIDLKKVRGFMNEVTSPTSHKSPTRFEHLAIAPYPYLRMHLWRFIVRKPTPESGIHSSQKATDGARSAKISTNQQKRCLRLSCVKVVHMTIHMM